LASGLTGCVFFFLVGLKDVGTKLRTIDLEWSFLLMGEGFQVGQPVFTGIVLRLVRCKSGVERGGFRFSLFLAKEAIDETARVLPPEKKFLISLWKHVGGDHCCQIQCWC